MSNEKLEVIIELSEEDKNLYINNLIKLHYPSIKEEDTEHTSLQQSYRSSFVIEKLYRSNNLVQENFSPIYTKTGLIRNIINDLYYTDDDLITH